LPNMRPKAGGRIGGSSSTMAGPSNGTTSSAGPSISILPCFRIR
jgi:hypothetical protein